MDDTIELRRQLRELDVEIRDGESNLRARIAAGRAAHAAARAAAAAESERLSAQRVESHARTLGELQVRLLRELEALERPFAAPAQAWMLEVRGKMATREAAAAVTAASRAAAAQPPPPTAAEMRLLRERDAAGRAGT